MRVARSLWISFLATALLAAGGQEPPAQGLYRSSVVGTDFDILREGDLDAFERLEFRGSGFPEMPDKRGSASLWQEAFLFVATFRDGARILLSIDADFETEEAARAEALRITPRLGKLPSALRRGVERVVVHRGGKDTTAFSDEGLVVLYSENATRRIGTHDLEETVFHESVHAAWDRETRFATGDELLVASAAAFQIEVSVLRQQVEAFRHCNCRHGDLEDPDEPGERSER